MSFPYVPTISVEAERGRVSNYIKRVSWTRLKRVLMGLTGMHRVLMAVQIQDLMLRLRFAVPCPSLLLSRSSLGNPFFKRESIHCALLHICNTERLNRF